MWIWSLCTVTPEPELSASRAPRSHVPKLKLSLYIQCVTSLSIQDQYLLNFKISDSVYTELKISLCSGNLAPWANCTMVDWKFIWALMKILKLYKKLFSFFYIWDLTMEKIYQFYIIYICTYGGFLYRLWIATGKKEVITITKSKFTISTTISLSIINTSKSNQVAFFYN